MKGKENLKRNHVFQKINLSKRIINCPFKKSLDCTQELKKTFTAQIFYLNDNIDTNWWPLHYRQSSGPHEGQSPPYKSVSTQWTLPSRLPEWAPFLVFRCHPPKITIIFGKNGIFEESLIWLLLAFFRKHLPSSQVQYDPGIWEHQYWQCFLGVQK